MHYEDDIVKGCDPGQHLDFWLEKFPSLLAHCYQVFDVQKKDSQLNRFYPKKNYHCENDDSDNSGCDLGEKMSKFRS
jgi:Ribonuclease 2-5A